MFTVVNPDHQQPALSEGPPALVGDHQPAPGAIPEMTPLSGTRFAGRAVGPEAGPARPGLYYEPGRSGCLFEGDLPSLTDILPQVGPPTKVTLLDCQNVDRVFLEETSGKAGAWVVVSGGAGAEGVDGKDMGEPLPGWSHCF